MTDSRTARPTPGPLLAAYRWLAIAFALLIVVQAWLGSQGTFNGAEWMVTGHAHLANGMFLIIIVQTALSWVLLGRGLITWREVGLNVVLVALTVTQIGLGYSTRNADIWPTMVSLHIPNGVLLMGVSTAAALLAWHATNARVTGNR